MAKQTEEEKIYESKLTAKQERILKYIEQQWFESGGYVPDYRSMCKALRIKSVSTIAGAIEKLEAKGYVKKVVKNNVVVRYEFIPSNLNEDVVKKVIYNKGDKYAIESKLVAKIPLIVRIKDKEDIVSVKNFKEYIAVPEEYQYQQFMFAFEAKGSALKKIGILDGSIVIVDTKKRYIHGDYVCMYDPEKNILYAQKYDRKQGKDNIYGKVVGAYTSITY